jgi:hypothetical protein
MGKKEEKSLKNPKKVLLFDKTKRKTVAETSRKNGK